MAFVAFLRKIQVDQLPGKLLLLLLWTLTFQVLGQASIEPYCISNRDNGARLPYLTNDNKGNSVICWTETDSTGKPHFYFAKSMDNGATFLAPKAIPVNDNIKAHNESMPKIAFKKDGSIWAFYQTAEPGGHFSSNIRYLISNDGGNTWTGSRFISSDSTTGKSRSFFDVATLADGEIGIVYLDHKVNKNDEGRPLLFAKSSGMALADPVVVDPQACECCRTDLFVDNSSAVRIAYRDLGKNNIRDMSYAFSNDAGKTFSTPTTISNDNWKIDGCPHSGPALAAHKSMVHAAWYTGKEGEKGVYYSAKTNNNDFAPRRLVTPNRTASHPQLCLLKDEVVLVWDELKESESEFKQVMFTTFGSRRFKSGALSTNGINATYPVVLALDEKSALVAWQQFNNEKSQIYVQKIELK